MASRWESLTSLSSADFIKKFVNPHVSKYTKENFDKLSKLSNYSFNEGNDLDSLLAYQKSVKTCLIKLQNFKVPEVTLDLPSLMDAEFSEAKKKLNQDMKDIDKELEIEIKKIESLREDKIEEAKSKVSQKELEFENSIADLSGNIKYLQDKKTSIEEILEQYSIPLSKQSLDLSSMTKEEINDLIITIKYITNYMGVTSPFLDKILSILYLPIKKENADQYIQLGKYIVHLISAGVLFFISKPYLIGAISLIYLAFIISNVFGKRKRVEILRYVNEIIENLNVETFLENDIEYKKLKEQLSLIESGSVSEYVESLKEEAAEKKEELVKELGIEEAEKILQGVYNSSLKDIDLAVKTAQKKVADNIRASIANLNKKLEEIAEKIRSIRDAFKPLGTKMNMTAELNTEVILKRMMYQGKVVSEISYDIGLKNIIFMYKTDAEREQQVKHMQLLLCNYLLNIKFDSMRVTIFDENYMGREFADFYTGKLCHYLISTEVKGWDTYYSSLKAIIKENLSRKGSKTVSEYNKIAVQKRMVEIPFNLTLAVSSNNEILKNKDFETTLSFSYDDGCIFWVLQKVPDAKDDTLIKTLSVLKERGVLFSNAPYSMDSMYPAGTVDGTYEQYEYNSDIGLQTISTLDYVIENNKTTARPWEVYREINFPKDKIWRGSTLSGINIRLGYVDGDESKCEYITLGDAPVHGMAAGASGSGKSGTANFQLAALFHEYPPEELQVVMLDFKNVEFSMYTKKANPLIPDKYIPMSIPHAKVISGTKDGEYALSIFDYLIHEMETREKLCTQNGVQNIRDYNLKVAAKDPSKRMARLLFFIDEFTVMFKDLPPKIVAKIEKAIDKLARLARSFGCHMYFQTQEFTATMPRSVMNQFGFRVCLRAAADVSEAVLGSKVSSLLPNRGQCYSNENMGQTQETTKRWIIPWISLPDMLEYMPKLEDWAAGNGPTGMKHLDRKPPFYDETKEHDEAEIITWHQNYMEQIGTQDRVFILGEATLFNHTSIAPDNIMINRDDRENIAISSDERIPLVNLINTFITNIKSKSEVPNYILNVADKDNYGLLDVDNKADPLTIEWSNPKTSADELLDFLTTVWEKREEKEDKENLKPLYIFLVNWEKKQGVGIAENRYTMAKLNHLLTRGPSNSMHFILATKTPSIFKDQLKQIYHRIVGKTNNLTESAAMIGDEVKFDSGFARYLGGDQEYTFKVYNTAIVGSVAETRVKIGRT